MSGPEITPEDTAEMRRRPGDWREYLRSEMARGTARRLQPAAKPAPLRPPGRRPGGWPPGTRPPDPPPPPDPAEVARAVAEYRHWAAAGHPPGDHHCECQPCQLLQGGTR
jgi:hypothetical protein